jgi:hypothetical protein
MPHFLLVAGLHQGVHGLKWRPGTFFGKSPSWLTAASATTRPEAASNSTSRARWRSPIIALHHLELIRADGLKVVAGCGFVVDYLSKHPEFADLVG